MASRPDFEEVADTLVANGAVYVAAHTQSLVDESAQLYYHLPVGVSDAQAETITTYLAEEIGHRPRDRQIGGVCIDDQPTPIVVSHVLHGGLHLYRRVPVYVDEGVAGLDPVSLEEGVDNVREVVASQSGLAPHPSETVALEELVAELAETGAASVEVELALLVREVPAVHLRIPMIPADGKPIVGPVDEVEVAGETYPLRTTLTLDGPYGSGMGWTALYVSDGVRGLDPVSVEDGCEGARELFDRASEADSVRDLR